MFYKYLFYYIYDNYIPGFAKSKILSSFDSEFPRDILTIVK